LDLTNCNFFTAYSFKQILIHCLLFSISLGIGDLIFRHSFQEAIAQDNAKISFQSTIENLDLPTFLMDPTGKITYANKEGIGFWNQIQHHIVLSEKENFLKTKANLFSLFKDDFSKEIKESINAKKMKS